MDYSHWALKWQNDKEFAIENDRLKTKKYIYSPFPKASTFGFQEGKIREIISSDIIARYLRITDNNVLFPTGFNSLCSAAFSENKLHSGMLNDDISNVFKEQMLKLGIGINEAKLIDMRHKEFLALLQNAFIDFYNEGIIKYKGFKVFYDKQTQKIYDYLDSPKKLPFIQHRCFVLDISDVIDEVVNKIEQIQCDDDIKSTLKQALRPKEIVSLNLAVSNGASLPIKMDNPEMLGGISYIFLNPDFIDIDNYVAGEEFEAVENYLSSDDDSIISTFSGLFALNPLTGADIPIFISTLYQDGIYLGIPDADEEDYSIAETTEININHVLENNHLINSDFLNDMTIEEARRAIIDSFTEAEVASVEFIYEGSEINLSSSDSFGPLFPFLEDKDTGAIKDLAGHLPYAFSSKLRPVLADDVDIIGSTMNGTINSLFVSGMTPMLAILYDDIGQIISIFSKEAYEEFKLWNGIDTMVVAKQNLISEVLMPIVIYSLIEKKLGKLPKLIDKLIVSERVIDINNLEIKKSNTNLIDFEKLLKNYSPDAIRLYSAINPFDEEMVIDENALKEFNDRINKFYSTIINPISKEAPDLEFKLFKLTKDIDEAMKSRDLKQYACLILEAINSIKEINQKNLLILLRLIYPIMPFAAEEAYKNIFNGRYSIINEGWPN